VAEGVVGGLGGPNIDPTSSSRPGRVLRRRAGSIARSDIGPVDRMTDRRPARVSRTGIRHPRAAATALVTGAIDRASGKAQGHRRNRLATPPADGPETWKRPEEPSVLSRVPQSKLRRSQGFGPSAPSGKNHYDRRHPTLATGLSTTFVVARPDSRRFSTAHPPVRERRRAAQRRSDTADSAAPRGSARRIADAGHNETPEGTNRFAGPSPPMQAPAARFLRTTVRSLRRRCKHLRRHLRSVMAPSGKTNSSGAEPGLAMGLSTNFGSRAPIPSALSTVHPRTRWRKG
jgi:hypothetical protein